MGNFSIRVELHNAEWPADYNKLHAEMQAKGFETTIKDSSTGIVYHLPTAEYNIEGNYNVDDVTEAARQAADAVGRKNMVFVTEGGKRRWTGLKQVAA